MAMAAKTWGADWWKTTGGGNVWNAVTFDREFNRIYIGTGNGSPWNQAVRGRAGGDNLFVASIVALDADTGKYQWHYQTVPGDNWDFDAVQDMILTDLMVDGSRRKVLMQANKNGFFYVIDRATGNLISADKFAHVTWAERIDLKSGRPVEAAGMRPVGPSSPVITFWPWVNGAHNWPSMSFSPRTGLVYIPGMDMRQTFDARAFHPTLSRPTGSSNGWGSRTSWVEDVSLLSATSQSDKFEQSAWLQARDPGTNKAVWQARQPGFWSGGTLTTGGDLVFIGQADGNLAAYHARTGELLWKFDCGRPISASPISYVLDGIQYIAVLAGWGGMPAVEGALTDPAFRMRYRGGGRGLFIFALGGEAEIKRRPFVAVIPIDVPGFVPQEDKVKLGQHLFDNNCNLCHGTDALSGGSAPDLRASPLAADEDQLKTIVLKGAMLPLGMPHYVDFSDQDVDAIYHYLRFTARKDLACAATGARVDGSPTMSGCGSSLTPN